MATIRSSLAMTDGMTGPIRKIHNAMNTLIDAFENVQDISANAVDTTSLQKARDLVADSITEWDRMADSVRGAGEAQEQFNSHIRDGANAADNLGNKLKGILATVGSIAGIKSALGWVEENLKLADTQRNGENQLKAVLANMGVEDIEIPVTTNAEEAINSLNACADAVNTLDGSTAETALMLDSATALDRLNTYSDRLNALDGSAIKNTLNLATRDAVTALDNYTGIAARLDGSAINTALLMDTADTLNKAKSFDNWANQTDGRTIQNSLILNGFNFPTAPFANRELSTLLTLDAENALNTLYNYENNLETLDGQKVTNTITANTSSAIKALSRYDKAANAFERFNG